MYNWEGFIQNCSSSLYKWTSNDIKKSTNYNFKLKRSIKIYQLICNDYSYNISRPSIPSYTDIRQTASDLRISDYKIKYAFFMKPWSACSVF